EWKKKAIDAAMPQGEQDADNSGDDTLGTNDRSDSDSVNAGSEEPQSKQGNRSDGEREQGLEKQKREPDERSSSPSQGKPKGRGFEIDADNWRQHLVMKADGDGLKSNSSQNVALCIQYEQRFAGIFAWNEFANEVYLLRRPPWDVTGNLNYWRPRKLMDTDVTACTGWLEYCGLSPRMNDVGKIIVRVAEHNRY